jgi:energy-coupling factor transporter ATP-binding protein EcfA2
VVLGNTDSGKSTLLKQLKILNGVEFTEKEISDFRSAILGQIALTLRELILQMEVAKAAIPPQCNYLAEFVGKESELGEKHVTDIELLWNSAECNAAFDLLGGQKVPYTSEYYMQNLPRILRPDYVPTHQGRWFFNVRHSKRKNFHSIY